MQMSKSMHRVAIWIACCAILLSSLAPSISHAIAAAKGVPDGWTEICTVGGAKLVKLDSGAPASKLPARDEKATHFEHCPFCLHQTAGLAPLPALAVSLPVLPDAQPHPALLHQTAPPKFSWAVAQPRAPPTLS
jgi:hypothetical protein